MGQMTLTDFREELTLAAGNRGHTNPQLDRWVNFAYMDVAGAVDMDELEEDTDVPTVANQAYIDKPAGASKVISVVNETTGGLLQYIDKTEYFRLDRTKVGDPVKWAVLSERVYLHPTPDSIDTIKLIHKIEPTALSAVGDTTVLDSVWDNAIYLLSVHYAMMSVGEDQRAVLWLNRALSYLQSRLTAEEIFIREPGLGLSMSVPKERLIAAMEEGLRGQMGA